MGVVGRAIGRYLAQQRGLYSVQLPASLNDELIDLVNTCNRDREARALRVLSRHQATGDGEHECKTIGWSELLKWRTDEDRVFAWTRGSGEPHSSFQSVVQPFITERFPGEPSGLCRTDLFSSLTARELWYTAASEPDQGSLSVQKFEATAQWVLRVLIHNYQYFGGGPGTHWSDPLLEHWANLFNGLGRDLAALTKRGSEIEPRHAWETPRRAGLPVHVDGEKGSRFLSRPPPDLSDTHWSSASFSKRWQDIVDSPVLSGGGPAVLLSALDNYLGTEEKARPWSELHWVLEHERGTPAAMVGREIFIGDEIPDLLEEPSPSYDAGPPSAWWTVTLDDIERALEHLEEEKYLRPSDSDGPIKTIVSDDEQLNLVRTRRGTVEHRHTSKRWRARITVSSVELDFREYWQQVILNLTPPEGTYDEKTAWVEPGDLAVDVVGRNVEAELIDVQQSDSGTDLRVEVDLQIDYLADKTYADGVIGGNWNPPATLTLSGRVHEWTDGEWGEGREAEASISLTVPSPFSPTVVVQGGSVVAPDNSDWFVTATDESEEWEPEATPDILLDEEQELDLAIYDGQLRVDAPAFVPLGGFELSSAELEDEASEEAFSSGRVFLREGDVVTKVPREPGVEEREVAAIKVRDISGDYSSTLSASVQSGTTSNAEPSRAARDSLFGQAQQGIVAGLQGSEDGDNELLPSLFQYVVSTSHSVDTWPKHEGGREADMFLAPGQEKDLPSVGDGASEELFSTDAWTEFARTGLRIVTELGLTDGESVPWLSAVSFARAEGQLVREYVVRHRELIRAGRAISKKDAFWASFPFSVVVVEGETGGGAGALHAVLLSPLHPARFAWQYSLERLARESDRNQIGEVLFGLAEGWNIPYTGTGVTIGGQDLPLISVPVDPGFDDDFAGWSALAVLEQKTGLPDLPPTAAGFEIPWAGQSGINDRVVERSLDDFMRVHPHLTSLEVDLRSLERAPRSSEIDEAILEFVGQRVVGKKGIGGAVRVWDSIGREGRPPTREEYLVNREAGDQQQRFEWRLYDGSPPPSDVALIENPSVNLSIQGGRDVHSSVGPLPLRRFIPSELVDGTLVESYSSRAQDDLLGLSSLLGELEHRTEGSNKACLKASPRRRALGIADAARWEVLGSFHADPALISSVVRSADDRRILWEWRPSWLNPGDGDLARRPYYVIARIPASLSKELERRHHLGEKQVGEMLRELGARGIGLATLSSHAGTHASAAAGFYYAMRLLGGGVGDSPPSHSAGTLRSDDVFTGIIPIDPLYSLIQAVAGDTSRGPRADLLLFQIGYTRVGDPAACLVPVEVKHRGFPGDPERFPESGDQRLQRPAKQLDNTANLLGRIVRGLGEVNPANDTGVWTEAARRLGLATLLELGCGLSGRRPSVELQSAVLDASLSGALRLSVADPLLLWFAPGASQSEGTVCVTDTREHKSSLIHELFIDPTEIPGLLWEGDEPGENERIATKRISETVGAVLGGCHFEETRGGVEKALARELAVEPPSPSSAGEAVPETGTDGETDADQRDSSSGEDGARIDRADVSGKKGDGSEKEPDTGERASSDVAEPERAQEEGEEEAATDEEVETRDEESAPRIIVGTESAGKRWTVLGRTETTGEPVALDLDRPKTMGVFGYMGSGKSYFLGTLIEGAAQPIPGLNSLGPPLGVVVFNYRRQASDRFELASLAEPNQEDDQVDRLKEEYAVDPLAVDDVHVLCLPGELREDRRREYGALSASEMYFDPDRLSLRDWELLMGEPGSSKVYAQTIRHTLNRLRTERERIMLSNLRERVEDHLTGNSLRAARFRFELIEDYVASEGAVDFADLLAPGRVVIIDLRKELFEKEDALRFFLICARQVSQVQGEFNKLVVFDEAHEYLSDAFGERMESRIRLMRHEGTSYVFATQDVGSIPSEVQRFITTNFVFDLGTRQNVEDMTSFAPEFEAADLLDREPGSCLIQANQSTDKLFSTPRAVKIRPRVTQHGGATRIHAD